MTSTASELIATYNAGREAERVNMKYAAMRGDAFRFLRGTCHLFHRRLGERGLAPAGPRAWLCGDLHLENVGTYLGDNDLTYFDVSDFDEAVLAPYAWDILRLATSVLVGAPTIGLKDGAATVFAKLLIDTYFQELVAGKPRWLERRTATGPIGELIENLKRRDMAKFLAKRTTMQGGKLVLLADMRRALAANDDDRKDLRAFLVQFAEQTSQRKPLKLIDAARRIAGTGSLGVARFVLLVEGANGPDLLDLKAALPSAVAPYAGLAQPAFASEAHRVVAIQTLFQANTPSLLSAHTFRGASFLLRQLQPSADRLDLHALATDKDGFGKVMADMARLTAWGHLRGTGRYGSATADELIGAAAGDRKAPAAILEAAVALARINAEDWAQYCAAYEAGVFGAPVNGGMDE